MSRLRGSIETTGHMKELIYLKINKENWAMSPGRK
jgi:hypothetical protein